MTLPQSKASVRNIAGRVLAGLIVLGALTIGPLLLFGDRLPFYVNVWRLEDDAPGLWLSVKTKREPGESAYVGRWVPAENGRKATLHDGSPYTFGPEAGLVLNADHTASITRLAQYDGNGRILCLISERANWYVSDATQQRVAIMLDPTYKVTDPLVIEHNLSTSKTVVQWQAEEAVAARQGYDEGRDVGIEMENELDCQAHLEAGKHFSFHVARRGSQLALFHTAGFPFTHAPHHTVLLEKQP